MRMVMGTGSTSRRIGRDGRYGNHIRRDEGIVGGISNTDRIDVEGRVIHYLKV